MQTKLIQGTAAARNSRAKSWADSLYRHLVDEQGFDRTEIIAVAAELIEKLTAEMSAPAPRD